jgi:hypothetical protein
MALEIHTRNRQKPGFENKIGTLIESLLRFFGDFICASGGYEWGDFAKSGNRDCERYRRIDRHILMIV